MSWDTITFSQLYDSDSRNGLTKPSKVRGSGWKMINMGELFANDRIYDIPMELVPLTEREKENAKVEKGDLLFARQSLVLEGAGKCSIVMEVSPLTVFESHIIRVRLKHDLANPLFYYYYFRSAFSPIKTIVSQCAQAGIRGSDLQELSVVFPPIDQQNRIAGVLTAYDDLIETNQRQIKLLEEAAQRLYKEWFVDLRFPGHENVPVVDGVPDGWSLHPLKDIVEFEIGGGWGEDCIRGKNEHEAYVIRGTDLDGLIRGEFLNIPLRFHTANNLASRKLEHGDIVFEVSGGSRTEGVARTTRIVDIMLEKWGKPVICASFCKRIKPLENVSQYLFDHFRYLRAEKITEEYDKRSASSIVNYRWKDFLDQRLILYPTDVVLSEYNLHAETIYTEIVNLSLQIESVKRARDRLLPKLMSGEIVV